MSRLTHGSAFPKRQRAMMSLPHLHFHTARHPVDYFLQFPYTFQDTLINPWLSARQRNNILHCEIHSLIPNSVNTYHFDQIILFSRILRNKYRYVISKLNTTNMYHTFTCVLKSPRVGERVYSIA